MSINPYSQRNTREHPYILKKGRKVYKGDTAQYNRYEKAGEIPKFVSDTNQPVFFALHAYDAEQYGVIMEFKALCDFKLAEIDNLDTIHELYSSVPKEIQRILINNYGYKPDTNTFGIRKSDHDKDNELSTFLCENGYDGYIISSKNIKTDSGRHFHPEIAICRNTHMMKFVQVVSTDEQIDSAIADYQDKINKPARKSKSTGKVGENRRLSPVSYGQRSWVSDARSVFEESPPTKTPFKSRSMFDDDDEDDDVPNISTRLFGGKKSKTSKRRMMIRYKRKSIKSHTKKSKLIRSSTSQGTGVFRLEDFSPLYKRNK